MATTSFTTQGLDYQTEAAAIERRRRLAEALQAQSMEPIAQQQTPAGGFAVPISPFQGAAKLAQAFVAARKQKQADEEQRALTAQQNERRSADMGVLASALQGRAASPGGLVEDASGNVTQSDPVSGQTPQERLSQSLSMIRDPAVQQMAMGLLAKDQDAYTLKPGERRIQGGKVIAEGALEKPGGPTADAPYTLSPGAKRFGPNGKVIADNPRSQSSTPYFSPQQTPNGIYAFDARTGTMRQITDKNGTPIVGAANDPKLQRELAAAKAGGHETGKEAAVAQMDLPRVTANANNAIQLVDQMIGSEDKKIPEHPGFQTSVGLGLGVATKHVPGSNAANFQALYDQVRGGAFLSAYESLKGGGSITEIEGKKATEAVTRMRTTQSEAEFIKAAREYQSILRKGVERAKAKAAAQPGHPPVVPDATQATGEVNWKDLGRKTP